MLIYHKCLTALIVECSNKCAALPLKPGRFTLCAVLCCLLTSCLDAMCCRVYNQWQFYFVNFRLLLLLNELNDCFACKSIFTKKIVTHFISLCNFIFLFISFHPESLFTFSIEYLQRVIGKIVKFYENISRI